MPERRLSTFLGALGTLLVILLLISNVLLFQIAGDDDEGGGSGENSGAQVAEQPALPPAPSGGTSNRATVDELDRLARTLDRQFAGLERSLAPLASLGTAADALPGAFGSLAFNLDLLAAQGAELGDGFGALQDIRTSTARLRNLQGELGRIRTNIAGVNRNTSALSDSGDRTLEQLTTSNAGIAQTNTGIANTNTQLADMIARVTQTNTGIDSLGNRMGNLDTTTKAVDSKTGSMVTLLSELRGDVQSLNNNLQVLISLSCQGPTPPSNCP